MLEAPGISARGLAGFGISVAFAVLVLAPVSTVTAAAPLPSVTGGRVRLLQPSSTNARARRCLTRLREELIAGGFEVAISEFGMGGEALWMVDPPSPRDGSLATITMIGNPDEGAAELWIVNGVPADYDDPIIVIGAQEAYEARCRTCHTVPRRATAPA